MSAGKISETGPEASSGKEKKTVLLRLSAGLWNEIAAWSEEEFRSINGQIEYLLTEAVRQRRKSGGPTGK